MLPPKPKLCRLYEIKDTADSQKMMLNIAPLGRVFTHLTWYSAIA